MKKFSTLSPDEKKEAVHHFTEAARARATQWEHEGHIERILDGEIDIDFSDWAQGFTTPAAESGSPISAEDVAIVLEDAAA